MEIKKKLPIGIEFFSDIITRNYYYVDKTGLIRELLNTCGSVNLFTRPRRFGKSLNMDMLKTFFEIGTATDLFANLEIMNDAELCKQHMGKYPVISISLKDVEGTDFQTAYDSLCIVIRDEAERFDYLLESEKLTTYDKANLIRLLEGNLKKAADLHNSLKLLTRLLYKHYDKQVIVLIDEYDVPLDKSHQNGYYPQMVSLIRSLFSQVLKTNKNMFFAAITGCLRIAKESIFTGLNNFKVRTISDVDYAEYFGFTDAEVRKMLQYYEIENTYDDIREWYDGYHFGNANVYCPWDVINQCDKFRLNPNAPMESHWENSSSNAIVQDILENATATTKDQIEALISGEHIEKALIPELTYADLDSKDTNTRQTYLWSVLFATGYLTEIGITENGLHKLVIPNREVRGIYEKKIKSWFKVTVMSNTTKWQQFCKAVKNGKALEIQRLFNEFMSNSISIRDTYVKKAMKENFYHGILLGLLQAEGNWVIKSNSESGTGYMDIQLEIPPEKIGCVIEVKYAEKARYDAACAEAMEQIDHNGYTELLKKDGMKTIHKYGFACYQKNCQVAYALEYVK